MPVYSAAKVVGIDSKFLRLYILKKERKERLWAVLLVASFSGLNVAPERSDSSGSTAGGVISVLALWACAIACYSSAGSSPLAFFPLLLPLPSRHSGASSWTSEASYNLTNAEDKKLGKTHTFSTDVDRLNFYVIEVMTS